MKEKVTAIILAGGKSSRMEGNNKSLLPVNGEPLILSIVNQLKNHFKEIIIGANEVEKYNFLNLKVIADIEKNNGPLMGILSCLKASTTEINFITACDIPVMKIELIKKMIKLSIDKEVVMPINENNKYEPLYAIYKKSIIYKIEDILKNNQRRIIDLLNHVNVEFVDFKNNDWYKNLNSKNDYLDFLKRKLN